MLSNKLTLLKYKIPADTIDHLTKSPAYNHSTSPIDDVCTDAIKTTTHSIAQFDVTVDIFDVISTSLKDANSTLATN